MEPIRPLNIPLSLNSNDKPKASEFRIFFLNILTSIHRPDDIYIYICINKHSRISKQIHQKWFIIENKKEEEEEGAKWKHSFSHAHTQQSCLKSCTTCIVNFIIGYGISPFSQWIGARTLHARTHAHTTHNQLRLHTPFFQWQRR